MKFDFGGGKGFMSLALVLYYFRNSYRITNKSGKAPPYAHSTWLFPRKRLGGGMEDQKVDFLQKAAMEENSNYLFILLDSI